MSGGPMVLKGTKEGNRMVMTGEGPGPSGTAKYKTVTINETADRVKFQMFMIVDNKENEMMTVNYTRRKK